MSIIVCHKNMPIIVTIYKNSIKLFIFDVFNVIFLPFI